MYYKLYNANENLLSKDVVTEYEEKYIMDIRAKLGDKQVCRTTLKRCCDSTNGAKIY